MALPADYFDQLFAATEDPWGFKDRWYEQRKRDITLACLPQRRFERGFEPGCANGELSARLASRCDELLVCDVSAKAAELARQRLADAGHVRVETRAIPQQWPEASFDLIVLSELGYYLDAVSLATLARVASASLRPGGTLLACHWLPTIEGCEHGGLAVHHILDAELDLPRVLRHQEDDFVLDVWTRDGASVGQREGLR